MRGSETPYAMLIKVRKIVGIPDTITYENFDDDRLKCLGVAGGQVLPLPVRFRRCCSYNTLALPCEFVISRAETLSRVVWVHIIEIETKHTTACIVEFING